MIALYNFYEQSSSNSIFIYFEHCRQHLDFKDNIKAPFDLNKVFYRSSTGLNSCIPGIKMNLLASFKDQNSSKQKICLTIIDIYPLYLIMLRIYASI